MRRIVVIASGPAGAACAARLKRRLREDEINLVIPAAATRQRDLSGPAGRRFAAALPNLEALAARELGVLEAEDIMPDLAEGEITVGSSRGSLNVRYTDLIMEVPATVRVPRPLHRAGNVFAWPMPGFAAEPEALDAALAAAAERDGQVLVTGGGAAALEAALLALEAGARVRWLRTSEPESPEIEPHMLALAVRLLGPRLDCVQLPDLAAERLSFTFGADGGNLESVTLPDGRVFACACCVWTSPLMARHPVLRERGVELDLMGRIVLAGSGNCPGLRLMGSGAAVPGAVLPGSGAELPAWPGGEETADLSGWLALDDTLGRDGAGRKTPQGALAVRGAGGNGLAYRRAGLSLREAGLRGFETEYAALGMDSAKARAEEDGGQGRVLLSLVCDKASRTLLGAQVIGLRGGEDDADGLFALALAALAEGSTLFALTRRARSGLPGRMLAAGAGILLNKLETIIRGISPDEFLASREAGAEFFTLDLRSMPDWRLGHVPGAHNIPLPQLKKRIQDEVPRFTPLVLVSAGGREAYVAACRLAGLGATDLYVLDGGMDLWPYETEPEG